MRILVSFALALAVLAPTIASADKSYNEGKGGTWDCAKDATVAINANNGTYTFKGACSRIAVNGNKNTVTIEATASLDVNGNANTVSAGQADAIDTPGNDNKVSYKNANARTHNLGTGNTLTAGGGGPAAKPATADSDKPAPAGAIDCAKSPSYEITDGNGSYAFVGTCDRIAVMGGDNKLTIEAVKHLTVTGATNTIDVGAVDKISAVGNDNVIRYAKGLSGAKPKIASVGNHNTITKH